MSFNNKNNKSSVESSTIKYEAMPSEDEPWVPRDAAFSSNSRAWEHEIAANNNRLRINVSGLVFETYESTLAKFPETLLGSPIKREPYYDESRQEYYFNRNRKAFDSILFFYQSGGKLFKPGDLRDDIFLDEISFYELTSVKRTEEPQERYDSQEDNMYVMENSWSHFLAGAVISISQLHSDPLAEKILSACSVLVVLAFVTALCLTTLPTFQQVAEFPCGVRHNNRSVCSDKADKDYLVLTGHSVWSVLHKVCVSWFALEFLARLVDASKRTAYLLSWLGLIDLLSFLPPCVLMILNLAETNAMPRELLDAAQFLPLLSVIKLSRYSLGLRTFWTTLRSNFRELAMLFYCLVINLIAFTGLIYYCEYEENEQFTSIPASFWYTIITMTTVGYGDVTPITFGGKFFGALCAVWGVTYVLAIPTTVIASNFNLRYQSHVERSKKQSTKEYVKEVRRHDTNIPERYRWTTQFRTV